MELDLKKLGLKAGLEVHQQLNTGKLFCRCPSVLREDSPDIIFKRKLRAVASELGEFDKAALEAVKKDISYVYEAYSDTTCEIEADQEPPKPVDGSAFETTLKIALLCNSKIVDDAVVMRKTVVDGSNTSGFQRTALIATGGKLKISNKEVGVQTIVLEEDAARPMQKKAGEIVYRLDRLGIPLIEFATDPDLFTPEEVKECALKIGELLRRTCRAKRGLGTIRQDVNVSIAAGARVEIKGVQELELIDEYVRQEALRQSKLLEIKSQMIDNNVSEQSFEFPPNDLSEIFASSECKFLKAKKVFGIKLGGCKGFLGIEIQKDRRFGTELAGYVKAKTGLKGIIHSDELPAYGISEDEISKICEKLDCEEKDAFAIVSGEKSLEALGVVLQRCLQALKGVPEETRNAIENAVTEYSRPLPGAARMYPETDLEIIKITSEQLKNLKKELPLTVEQRLELYTKHGLGAKLSKEMSLNNYACFFEELLKKGFNATVTAALLLDNFREMRRDNVPVENISEEMVIEILTAVKKGELTKEVLLAVTAEYAKYPEQKLKAIIQKFGFEKFSGEKTREVVKKVIEKNSALVREKKLGAMKALMGDVMKELKGKASGAEINRILKEEIEKLK